MKLLLAGTPEFSVPIFEELIKKFEIVAIITQPDKPKNRGYSLEASPVKKLAQKYDIKVYDPEKISTIYDQIKDLEFDFFLTAAYGQYIPEKILNLPKIASLNVHGSLLPKYRGAAPIQHALLNGDDETGISLIYMTKKMDAGNILKIAKIKLNGNENADDLFLQMSKIASKNIVLWLEQIYQKDFSEIVQDEEKVSLSPKLLKEDALLEVDKLSVKDFINKVRAFSLNPGAYLIKDGKRVKIFRATTSLVKNAFVVEVQSQKIYCYEYQFEGKKRVKLNFNLLFFNSVI